MGIKVKARQTKLAVGPSKGEYRFIMQAEIYSTLKQEKVVSEASIRSGIPKAVPGLGTMRFGLQAAAVAKVEDVSSGLITARKVIFTPSTTIKQELKGASINITCYDKEGNVIKQVNSSDPGDVDDEGGSDNPGGGGLDENPLG